MSTASQISLSLDEFLRRPQRDNGRREELIEGALLLSPSAKAWHTDIVRSLRRKLASLEDKGYVLINDASCILGQQSMPVPDLAAVRGDRWNQAVANDGWLHGAPELVIEVASPGDKNLLRKADLYLHNGAEQVWLVDRKTQTIVVVTQEDTREARLHESVEFGGVAVKIEEIFKRQ